MSALSRVLGQVRTFALVTLAVTGVVLLPGTAAAAPAQAGCDARTNNTYDKLLECVRVDGVREHQAALQAIADANGGNRFSGFAGYNASVDYVVDTLEAAGYDPEVQAFDYLAFEVVGPSALQQTAPGTVTYVEGVDFGAITQTDPGDVTARGHGRRPAARPGQHLDQRVRGRGLRRLPCREHRAAPAWHLHVRDEGRERRGGRRRRDRDLQPGQHDRRRTATASRRSRSRPTTPAASR